MRFGGACACIAYQARLIPKREDTHLVRGRLPKLGAARRRRGGSGREESHPQGVATG